MRTVFITFLFVASLSIVAYSQNANDVIKISFNDLEKEILEKSDKIKIINFWATWCKPCIAEMPSFDEVGTADSENIKLYFVSLDFPEDLTKVINFQQKKKFNSQIILLADTNYDFFMPKISKEWTGAIPATLFVDKDGNKYFYEKPFTKKELSEVVNGFLN